MTPRGASAAGFVVIVPVMLPCGDSAGAVGAGVAEAPATGAVEAGAPAAGGVACVLLVVAGGAATAAAVAFSAPCAPGAVAGAATVAPAIEGFSGTRTGGSPSQAASHASCPARARTSVERLQFIVMLRSIGDREGRVDLLGLEHRGGARARRHDVPACRPPGADGWKAVRALEVGRDDDLDVGAHERRDARDDAHEACRVRRLEGRPRELGAQPRHEPR